VAGTKRAVSFELTGRAAIVPSSTNNHWVYLGPSDCAIKLISFREAEGKRLDVDPFVEARFP
jgi:hypothetical protein